MNRRRSFPARSGYTLIEMIVALGAASVLLAGLGSTVFLSSQAFQSSDMPMARRVDAAEIQRQILGDLRYASTFSERTSNAVTFTVPDRTGDGLPDTIRYAWSGAGTPLTYSLNGSEAQTLLASVENLTLTYRTQTLNAPVIPDEGSPATILFVSAGTVQQVEQTSLQKLAGVPAEHYVAPTDTEKQRIARIEAAGYSVVAIIQSATDAEVQQALSESDAVYVSGEASSANLSSLYFSTSLGVVTECLNAVADFGFCKSASTDSGFAMIVKTPVHYITSELAAGQTTFLKGPQSLLVAASPYSPDLQGLTTVPAADPAPAMLALNTGAQRADGSGKVAARRVQLPFGFDGFNPSQLNDDGWQLIVRSIDWVLGNGEDGIPNVEDPFNPNFGYETLFSQSVNRAREQIATQAQLENAGILQTISVFVGGSNGEVRVAIYSDVNSEPYALLAESSVMKSNDRGSWLTFSMTNLNLQPGMYWLAVSMDNGNHYIKGDVVATGRSRAIRHRATADGFTKLWGTSQSVVDGAAFSIYATVKPN